MKKMPWFKLYSEARSDVKLRSLTDTQHRIWFDLLCFASEQPERGTIKGFTLHYVAVEAARNDKEALISTLDALQAIRGVTWRYTGDTEVEIVFTNFADRQERKPSNTPERIKARVAKSRQNKTSNGIAPCIAPVTPCNAPIEERDKKTETTTAAGGDVTPDVTPTVDGGLLPGPDTPTSKPLPPDSSPGRAASGTAPIPGLDAAVAEARVRYGEKIAAVVRINGRDIAETLGGRFDYYLAALDQAKKSPKEISDVHRFAIVVAQRFVRTGIPADPVAMRPGGDRGPPEPTKYHFAPADSRHRRKISSPKPVGGQ